MYLTASQVKACAEAVREDIRDAETNGLAIDGRVGVRIEAMDLLDVAERACANDPTIVDLLGSAGSICAAAARDLGRPVAWEDNGATRPGDVAFLFTMTL